MWPISLPLLINTQHYSLSQIAICLLWRQTPLIKDVFHPASYTVDHLLSGLRAKFVDCACKSCDLEIAHTCYASPDCARVTQSRDCLLNLWECAIQSRDCANSQIARNIYIKTNSSGQLMHLHMQVGLAAALMCAPLQIQNRSYFKAELPW